MQVTSKLVFNVSKIAILFLILAWGSSVAWNANLKLQKELTPIEIPPETQPPFEASLQPQAGAPVGWVKINLKPTQAFVVGDHISAEVEVRVNWLKWWENESASVHLIFPDSICFIDSWSNISEHNWSFVLWDCESRYATYVIYRKNITMWYTHEGVYGVNITIWSPYSIELLSMFGTGTRTVHFIFPEIVHIKSYTYLVEQARYLEELRNTKITLILSEEILGLTIIAVSPSAVLLLDLLEETIHSARKKTDRNQSEVTYIY